MKRQSTSKLLRLMVAVFALFLLVMAGSVLSACGGETVEENPNNNTPAEVHKHTYGAAEHTAIAKCGSTGYDVYTCTVCGDKYAIVTAATGEHEFNEQGVCKTCGLKLPADYKAYDDSSLREYLATELGKINTAVGNISKPEEAHKHKFVEDEDLALEASCLSAGVTVGKCDCGSTTVLGWTDPLQHKYEAVEGSAKAATCTTDGQILMRCTVCHDEYMAVNENDRAKGHDFQRTSADKDKDANCITPKLLAYECTKCHEIEYQQLDDKLNEKHHSDVNGESHDNDWIPDNLWTEYVTDGAVPSVPADGSEPKYQPTNTLKVSYAECPVCHKTAWKYEEVECRHTWEVRVAKEATCEEDGRFNAYCAACERYANQVPVNGDYPDSTKWSATQTDAIVPALGHAYTVENLKSFYEVDRDDDGNIVTDDEDGRISANTTCWEGTVCTRCERNIAVAVEDNDGTIEIVKDKDGKDLVLDINDYVATKGSNILDFATDRLNERYLKQIIKEVLARNPEVTEEELTKDTKAMELLQSYADVVAPFFAKKLFPREWHAWTLYNPVVKDGKIVDRTITLDSGITLVPPEDAEAPVYETCMTGGTYWYWCIDTACTKHVEGNVRGRWITVDHDPLMHDWQEDTSAEDTDPTCTKSGVKHYKCANHFTITNPDRTTTEWKCDATLEVSIDATKEEEITKPDHFWEANYRTQDKDGENVWDPDYLKLWAKKGVLKLKPTAATSALEGSVGDEDAIFAQLTPEQIEEFAKAVMPQAHLWEKDEEATNELLGERTCFDGGATVYKCACEMKDGECCSDAEDGKCPAWTEKGVPAHLTNEDDENEFGTFIIYGKDYSERGERFNIEVTYCKFCGLEISRKVLTDRNYKHFPFDRAKIAALLETHVPAYTEEEIDGVIVRTYTNPEEFMSEEAIAARKEYANVWIAIQKYWFEDSMDEKYEADLFNYLYTKGNPKNDSKFTIFCNDCFNAEFDFVVSEDHACEEFTFTDNPTRVIYAYDPKTNEYIKITDATAQTYNSCEYVYYEQYEKECDTCKTTFRYATQDGKGYNRYTRLTKTTDGEYVEPVGTHYLVPMEKYWERESYKVENEEVTLDWICALCGQIVQRTVKYAVPETTTKEATPTLETTLAKELIDVNADAKYVLVVDLDGIICDTDLNDRGDKDKDKVLQINDLIYFGTELTEAEGYDYKVNVNFVLKEGDEDKVLKIRINDGTAHTLNKRKVSYLRNDDFFTFTNADGTENKAAVKEYEDLWKARYGEDADSDSARIKALFNEGGEIRLGDKVKLTEQLEIKTDTKLDLGGHELKASARLSTKDVDLTIENGDVSGNLTTVGHGNITVKNATVTTETGKTPIFFAPTDKSTQTPTDSVITLDNVVIVGKQAAVVVQGLVSGATLKMNKCTVITDDSTGTAALWIAGKESKVEATDCVFYSQWQAVHVNGGESIFTNCTFIAGIHTDNKTEGESVWVSGSNATPKEAEAVFVIAAKGGGYGKTAKVTLNGDCKFLLGKNDTIEEKTESATITATEKIGDSDWYYTPNDTTTNTKKLISVNAVNDGAATLVLNETTAKTLSITKENAKSFCGAWKIAGSGNENPLTIVINGETVNVTKHDAQLKKSNS